MECQRDGQRANPASAKTVSLDSKTFEVKKKKRVESSIKIILLCTQRKM